MLISDRVDTLKDMLFKCMVEALKEHHFTSTTDEKLQEVIKSVVSQVIYSNVNKTTHRALGGVMSKSRVAKELFEKYVEKHDEVFPIKYGNTSKNRIKHLILKAVINFDIECDELRALDKGKKRVSIK